MSIVGLLSASAEDESQRWLYAAGLASALVAALVLVAVADRQQVVQSRLRARRARYEIFLRRVESRLGIYYDPKMSEGAREAWLETHWTWLESVAREAAGLLREAESDLQACGYEEAEAMASIVDRLWTVAETRFGPGLDR